jgi:hypothetical protein
MATSTSLADSSLSLSQKKKKGLAFSLLAGRPTW